MSMAASSYHINDSDSRGTFMWRQGHGVGVQSRNHLRMPSRYRRGVGVAYEQRRQRTRTGMKGKVNMSIVLRCVALRDVKMLWIKMKGCEADINHLVSTT